MAAAEPHGLQQELSCDRGLAEPRAALSQPCLLPRGLSPSWEGTSSSPSCLWHGAGRLEHPQPPSSSSSHPPGLCISQSRTTMNREQSQVWHHGHGTPWEPSGAAASSGWELLGPPCALCIQHWDSRVLLSPSCSLLPHLAQGEPKAPVPLPWHREGTRNLPQGPLTFQGFLHSPSLSQAWFWGPNLISPLSC